VLPILALEPRETDRSKFADGLRSPQHEVADACLTALEKLPPSNAANDMLPIVRALRSVGDQKADVKTRDRLVQLLRRVTGQTIGPDRAAWTDWFVKTHPDHAGKLGGTDGVDVASWQKRFATLDWLQGDSARGKIVFEKASCATCHSGGSALGPDLRGSASRLSRGDLLTAIIEPNRDIAPQYRSVQLVTTDGKVHQGLVVYEASDGVMLQTGATTTVRVAGNAIESRGSTDVSLMPAGLLDKLPDRDIADLLAFMRELK
jgi:putative heme-binding domain-containing protein